MKKQYIQILLEEYKALRDICEEYQRLMGEHGLTKYELEALKEKYNELAQRYNQIVAYINPPQEDEEKKRKIGF